MDKVEDKMEVDAPTISIDLPIYEYVRDRQLQHGLKYEDHRQYRSYCSRTIHRLRRSLNNVQGIPATAKARHTRARKLQDISNAMVLEAGEKHSQYAERMLVIPLLLTERAWSYAMQLKQEVSEYPRRRFHMVKRLEKAAEHATRFEKLVHDSDSPCSERTKSEATAYAAYVNGLHLMEREKWDKAMDEFHKSLQLYVTLSLSVKRESLTEEYHKRIEELRASLRYCTFTLGKKPTARKIKMPSTLQFHDIAFKHVRALEEEEARQAAAAAPIQKSKGKTATVPAASPATKSPTKEGAATEPLKVLSITKMVKASAPAAKPGDEEEDDEFEETREVMDEEQSEEEEDESEEESEDEQPRGGGVTGLVKGWLGGAWS